MKSDPKTLILPVLMIAVGTGWLLTAQEVVPHVDWIWTLGLIAIGALAFIVSGVDKMSVVIGPLFLAAGLLSILRQTALIDMDTEIPLLVILTGITLLLARRPAVPVPTWIVQQKPADDERAGNAPHGRAAEAAPNVGSR